MTCYILQSFAEMFFLLDELFKENNGYTVFQSTEMIFNYELKDKNCFQWSVISAYV